MISILKTLKDNINNNTDYAAELYYFPRREIQSVCITPISRGTIDTTTNSVPLTYSFEVIVAKKILYDSSNNVFERVAETALSLETFVIDTLLPTYLNEYKIVNESINYEPTIIQGENYVQMSFTLINS